MFKKAIALGSFILLVGAGCSSASTVTPTTDVDSDDVVVPQNQPTENQTPPEVPTENGPATTDSGMKEITLAEVQAANNTEKCWAIVNGNVYDLTTWMGQHPGGKQAIKQICGKDGSTVFNRQHGGQAQAEKALASFQIGILKK